MSSPPPPPPPPPSPSLSRPSPSKQCTNRTHVASERFKAPTRLQTRVHCESLLNLGHLYPPRCGGKTLELRLPQGCRALKAGGRHIVLRAIVACTALRLTQTDTRQSIRLICEFKQCPQCSVEATTARRPIRQTCASPSCSPTSSRPCRRTHHTTKAVTIGKRQKSQTCRSKGALRSNRWR